MTWDCSSTQALTPGDGIPGIGWNRLLAWLLVKRGDEACTNENSGGTAFISAIRCVTETNSLAGAVQLSPSIDQNPLTKGWVKTPVGWKRDRGHIAPVNVQVFPGATVVRVSLALGNLPASIASAFPLKNGNVLGQTSNVALFGSPGDFWASSDLFGSAPNNMMFDLSFLDVPSLIPAGVKANKAFRMYLLFCCWYFSRPCTHNQGVFVGSGAATAAEGLTVNLRSGSMDALDPEVAPTDAILATFVLGGNEFSLPDLLGRTYLAATKTVAAVGTGVIGYAEVLGATRSDGVSTDHGRTRLLIPVSTLQAINTIAVDNTAVTVGNNISVYDFGMQFKVGN